MFVLSFSTILAVESDCVLTISFPKTPAPLSILSASEWIFPVTSLRTVTATPTCSAANAGFVDATTHSTSGRRAPAPYNRVKGIF
jgi:hypothetical protein